MRTVANKSTLMAALCTILLTGCQQRSISLNGGGVMSFMEVGQILLEPSDARDAAADEERVAADSRPAEPSPPTATSTRQSRPTTAPTTQSAERGEYSRPRVPQPLSVTVVLAASVGVPPPARTEGQEVAQSSIGKASLLSSLSPVAGGPGATAGVFRSVGKRGLQIGPPLRSGLMLNVDIFTPLANPVTPRCQELVIGGHFADLAACRLHFRR